MLRCAKNRQKKVPNTPTPEGDPSDEEYAEDRYRLAVTALEGALKVAPDDFNVIGNLAETYLLARMHDKALPLWTRMLVESPDHPLVMTFLGVTLYGMGREEEALAMAERAIEVEPTMGMAHELVLEIHEKAGREAEATMARKRVTYYEWLPEFLALPFSEERYAFVARFAGFAGSEGGAVDAKAEVEALIKAGTGDAQVFLAAICWHHEHHGEIEDSIYKALEDQGANDLLMRLLENASSTCTTRSTAMALARLKDPRALGAIAPLLPGDTRFAFDSNIAGALAVLGDPKAVDALVTVLAPDFVVPENRGEDPMMSGLGRQMARERAAYALGHFPTDGARAALEAGLQNTNVAPACHLALYHLTNNATHLAAVEEALKTEAFGSDWTALEALKRIGTKEAVALAEKYKDED